MTTDSRPRDSYHQLIRLQSVTEAQVESAMQQRGVITESAMQQRGDLRRTDHALVVQSCQSHGDLGSASEPECGSSLPVHRENDGISMHLAEF